MKKSLLFLPDISGFTEFVQNTEVEHSQHVIAELLEILIDANTIGLELAEIEGDALFFYKEEQVPTLEEFLEQVELMYTAFYSHLKLLEKHRICPCNACAKAPELELKIIAHSGEIQFINVHNSRKPFGTQVIEAHRLMKNNVPSDNYLLISDSLATDLGLSAGTYSEQYDFAPGQNRYDGRDVHYLYSKIDPTKLTLEEPNGNYEVTFTEPPNIKECREYPVAAEVLYEYISNFRYRHLWNQDADRFDFNENEVTKLGSPHVCVINGSDINFVTVTKPVEEGQLIYGEMTENPPPVDQLYQFFIITPLSTDSCRLELETYWRARSPVKKVMLRLFVKKILRNSVLKVLENLNELVIKPMPVDTSVG
ncbi:MAG: DUF2652 domain-containing protein [Bacteroidota bacterium]